MDTEFKLSIPCELYDELKIRAKKQNMTKIDYLRRAIKFGMLGLSVIESADSKLFIEENGKRQEIIS